VQTTIHVHNSLRVSVRGIVTALLDWRPLLLVGVYVVLVLLFTQVPLSYSFQVGNERGIQSDLPFLYNFNPHEASDAAGTWRWSRSESHIVVPAVGERNLIVSMRIISHRSQRLPDVPPTVLNLQLDGSTSTPVTLRPEGARYMVYVPASELRDGDLWLGLETQQWSPPGDRRDNLGVAIGGPVTIKSIAADDGLVLPNSDMLLMWSASLLLFWFTLRALSFTPNMALALLLPVAVVLPALIPLTAPRLGFGTFWSMQFGLIGLGTALFCVLSVPPLLRRLDAQPRAALLRWLLLLIVITFMLKYAARLYPASMPGDLQLHVNRYLMTVLGDVYIRAQHRGLPFPFPNGTYVLVAPFHLLSGYSIHGLFELMAGIMEASAVLLMYLLVTRLSGQARLGLLAAAIYALTAGNYMVTWFAFQTQVAAQWFTVLLVTVLAYTWPHRRDWFTWWVVVMLLIQIFLAHIGQFMNLSLVGLLLVPLLWWRADSDEARAGVRWIAGAGLAAGLFVALFYYTAFFDLIIEQVTGVATEGLNELTEREPIPRAVSLRALWEGGLITHFGFFPVLLAIPGALMLAAPRLRGSIVPPLVWLSFAVSISQGILPFITLNSITTRWLMFSAWAIAVAGAWGLWLLWRRGRVARVVALAMAAYVCWITVEVWINAMALRLPPIEPF
jgi:hypothetical protein